MRSNLHFSLSSHHGPDTADQMTNPVFLVRGPKGGAPREPKNIVEITRREELKKKTHKCVYEHLDSPPYSACLDPIPFSIANIPINEQTTFQDPDPPLGGAHAGQIRGTLESFGTLKNMRITAHRTWGLTTNRSTAKNILKHQHSPRISEIPRVS